MLAALAAMVIALSIFEGGLTRMLLYGYYTGVELAPHEVVFLSVPIFSAAATISLGYLLLGRGRLTSLCALFYCSILLLGGHRNLFIMFGGSVMAIWSLQYGRMRYGAMSLSLAGIMFILLMIVGIYRNFGWAESKQALELLVDNRISFLNPMSQEFGTTFNVFKIYHLFPHEEFTGWYPGESYVRAVIGFIPRILWPSRPDSIATVFSQLFANIGEGLGFSVNLEAYINFGIIGVFVVNALIMCLTVVIFRGEFVMKGNMAGIAFYTLLTFVAFNINRIDLQTVIKMGLLMAIMFYGIGKLLIRATGSAVTLENRRIERNNM